MNCLNFYCISFMLTPFTYVSTWQIPRNIRWKLHRSCRFSVADMVINVTFIHAFFRFLLSLHFPLITSSSFIMRHSKMLIRYYPLSLPSFSCCFLSFFFKSVMENAQIVSDRLFGRNENSISAIGWHIWLWPKILVSEKEEGQKFPK